MTGTNRVSVTTCLCALTVMLLWSSWAPAQSRPTASRDEAAHDDFSAALSGELAPNRYGGYQYRGPSPTSPIDRGLQFANSPRPNAPGTGEDTGPDVTAGPAREIEQTQYPLSDPAPDGTDRAAPSPHSARTWSPPIVAQPTPPPATEPQGWALQVEAPADVTHVFGSGDTLGITSVTGGVVLETPRLPGASVRPHFGWHLLNGPTRTDLPEQLYDASLEVRMYWPFGERLIGEFAIAPSVFSDFENTSGDALRFVGRAVAYYRWSNTVRFAGGATYLDREDVLVLPIAGVIWTPTPDYRLNLLFPQPKIAFRFRQDDCHERWVYVSGELGGGSWAIERSSGRDDVASYRDLRLMTGIEFKYADKSSWRVEAGYVFGRELEYVSGIGDYEPDDTAMVRAAIVY